MRSLLSWFSLIVITVGLAPAVHSQPRARKATSATKAELERLEARIEEQQKQIDRLIKAQQQYLQAVRGMFDGAVSSKDDVRVDEPKPVEPRPTQPAAVDKTAPAFTDTKPAKSKLDAAVVKPKKAGAGTIVGKVTGVGDAVIYVEDIMETGKGTATMKQEGKQFVPRLLVVQKGTNVAFPNLDAIFHNVFSMTPEHAFDLGSYQKGESKSLTMAKSGVVTVYCNMHPQMVGHILVVPSSHYARVGKDGFFRLTNVPAGRHRVVAWAPNAKSVIADADVSDAGVVTLELELKKGRSSPHTKKDGLPYTSYAD